MAHTTHGHYIPGTEIGPSPDRVVRCGGLMLCTRCASEVAATHAANVEFDLPEQRAHISDRFRIEEERPINEVDELARRKQIRQLFYFFAKDLDNLLSDGRAKSLAFSELESSAMWAQRSITGF